MGETDPRAPEVPPPGHPRGAAMGGRIIEILGWLIVAFGAGVIVLQLAYGSVRIGGIVLALFIAVAGAATVVVGRSIEGSRER